MQHSKYTNSLCLLMEINKHKLNMEHSFIKIYIQLLIKLQSCYCSINISDMILFFMHKHAYTSHACLPHNIIVEGAVFQHMATSPPQIVVIASYLHARRSRSNTSGTLLLSFFNRLI